MNEQILNELQRTNDILVGIALMLLFGTILWSIKSVGAIYKYGIEIKSKTWNDAASSLYTKGKNSDLLKFSINKLKKEPKNTTSLYWKAKAEKELNKYEDLKSTLSDLLEEAPSWKEEWMNEYTENQTTQPDSGSNS